MNIYLTTSKGYFIKGIHNNGAYFTNRKEMAYRFNAMSVTVFAYIKTQVETTLKCELEVEYS